MRYLYSMVVGWFVFTSTGACDPPSPKTDLSDIAVDYAISAIPPNNSQKLTMKESPNDASKVSAICDMSNNDHPTFSLSTGKHQNDWIQIVCDRPDCFSEVSGFWFTCDPTHPLRDGEEMEAARKKLPACPIGWVRWRASDHTAMFQATLDPRNLTEECD